MCARHGRSERTEVSEHQTRDLQMAVKLEDNLIIIIDITVIMKMYS
jgi:hypothetical protein